MLTVVQKQANFCPIPTRQFHSFACGVQRSMSDDDDWLSARPDPEEPHRQRGDIPAERHVVPSGYGRSTVPPPRLLQRPKDSDDASNNATAEDSPAPKTLKQKEAEYAAARARIFGSKGSGANGGRAQGRARGRGGRGAGNAACHGGNSMARRKVDDATDPDYNRNPELYAPRFSPNPLDGPIPGNGSRYVPPTYENEFPALGQ